MLYNTLITVFPPHTPVRSFLCPSHPNPDPVSPWKANWHLNNNYTIKQKQRNCSRTKQTNKQKKIKERLLETHIDIVSCSYAQESRKTQNWKP